MKQVEKVIVIGSGPAGLSAAIYLSRGGLDPLVLTGDLPGGQPSIATVIDDYPGFPEGIEAPKLTQLFWQQAERFGARFLRGKVTSVNFSKKPFEVQTGEQVLYAQAIILALGSSPKWLGLPSEQKLIGRGVSICATCDGPFFKNKKIAVVGGGDAALKEAIYLSKLAENVTIIHRRDTLRAQDELQSQAKSKQNINFLFNSEVVEVLGEDKVSGLKVKNNKDSKSTILEVEGVFVAVGHQPETDFLQGQIKLDQGGYIVVQNDTKTSIEGVFAAGDVADPIYRQVITASGSGAKAALDVERYLDNLKA